MKKIALFALLILSAQSFSGCGFGTCGPDRGGCGGPEKIAYGCQGPNLYCSRIIYMGRVVNPQNDFDCKTLLQNSDARLCTNIIQELDVTPDPGPAGPAN